MKGHSLNAEQILGLASGARTFVGGPVLLVTDPGVVEAGLVRSIEDALRAGVERRPESSANASSVSVMPAEPTICAATFVA